MRVAVALLAALTLAAGAACGGGSEGNTGAAKRNINADDQRRAKSMLLGLADFPEGWRASAPEPENRGGQARFRRCVGVDYSSINLTGTARSRDFAMGQATEASSEAQIAATASQAQQGFQQLVAGMNGSKVKDCVEKLIPKSSDYKIGDVDVGELRMTAPANVEKAKAWQIVIPLEVTSGASKGVSATAYLDFIALLKNDAVTTVETSDVITPFDPTLREGLVKTVAARMA
jgi:hypothetical protein